MRRARRPVAVAAVVALLVGLAGCGGGGHRAGPATTAFDPFSPGSTVTTAPPGVPSTAPVATAPPPTAPLQWAPCPAAGLVRFECATLTVPLDPARPGGATLGLALARHRATGERLGSLLLNPGGPGVSAVDDLPGLYQQLNPELQARFDVVAFDPPGVGHSAGVTCEASQDLSAYLHVDPAPVDAAGLSRLLDADARFTQACGRRDGAELPFVSTEVAAHDMDLVRAALGDARLTYLGFSYGTFLGATYAEEYPGHVRAMVLDGAIDPSLDAFSLLDQQSAALDRQLTQFFAQCVADPRCAWRPSGAAQSDFSALLARVRATPLVVGDRRVGPAELLLGTAQALYSTDTWPLLTRALAAAERGDGRLILALYDTYVERAPDGSYSSLITSLDAVDCVDTPVPSISRIEAHAATSAALAPNFGLLNLYSDFVCDDWPVPATGTPHDIRAPGAPPIVVVGSTGDPITPYAWAQHLAATLASGVLLTRVGDGHTAYGVSTCIDDEVDRYLVDGTPPAAGTRCGTGTNPSPV